MHTTLPEGYPARYEGSIPVRNGRRIFTRSIMPSDGPLIMDLFGRISPQSIFQEKILRDPGYEANYSLRNGFYHVEINV